MHTKCQWTGLTHCSGRAQKIQQVKGHFNVRYYLLLLCVSSVASEPWRGHAPTPFVGGASCALRHDQSGQGRPKNDGNGHGMCGLRGKYERPWQEARQRCKKLGNKGKYRIRLTSALEQKKNSTATLTCLTMTMTWGGHFDPTTFDLTPLCTAFARFAWPPNMCMKLQHTRTLNSTDTENMHIYNDKYTHI